MATAISGIWNHIAGGQALPAVAPMDSSTAGSSGSDSATISANDFLTLLVTEMKNQDPTANTDPNEYINQLVSVNSLEQLININQTLSTATGSSGASSPTGKVAASDTAADSLGAESTGISAQGATPSHAVGRTSAQTSAGQPVVHGRDAKSVSGNLSIPAENLAAERVARSLGG
jgi:flagellar basal-body rod modification protein FlgD